MISSSAGTAFAIRRGGFGSSKAICRSTSCRSFPAKAGSQRQQLVQRGAQRVDVGAVVDRHALGQRLLRTHVTQRPHQVARHRQAGLAVLHVGQPEVGHPHAAATVQQQVARLDVAVDDAHLVGVVQRLRRLDAQLRHAPEVSPARAASRQRRVRRRRRPPSSAEAGAAVGRRRRPRRRSVGGVGRRRRACRPPQPPDHVGQRAAVDELHGVEVDAALAADGEDRHDVGVVQARRRPRLVLEALQVARVHRRRERQHLQRHPPIQRDLLRLVDDAHAAPADLADDAEVAEDARRGRVGRPCHNTVVGRSGRNTTRWGRVAC